MTGLLLTKFIISITLNTAINSVFNKAYHIYNTLVAKP